VSALPESSRSFFTPCGKQRPPSVGAQLPPDRELAAQPLPTARPRRDAWRGSDRPCECRSLAQAVTRAWTTSADPPSDANMRHPMRLTAERTLNPARRCTEANGTLTAAIREPPRLENFAGVDQDSLRYHCAAVEPSANTPSIATYVSDGARRLAVGATIRHKLQKPSYSVVVMFWFFRAIPPWIAQNAIHLRASRLAAGIEAADRRPSWCEKQLFF